MRNIEVPYATSHQLDCLNIHSPTHVLISVSSPLNRRPNRFRSVPGTPTCDIIPLSLPFVSLIPIRLPLSGLSLRISPARIPSLAVQPNDSTMSDFQVVFNGLHPDVKRRFVQISKFIIHSQL